MSDNSWHYKGGLPPVGIVCEFMVGNFWKSCEIKGSANDYGAPVVLAQIGNAAKLVGRPELFRPIKTERELAIEEMSMLFHSVGNGEINDLALGAIYDAGYRKNES